MEDLQELHLHVPEAAMVSDAIYNKPLPSSSPLKTWKWWLMMSIFTFFILAGQSAATLLGRFYYNQGGKSLWMSTIVQSCGSPLLLPSLLLFRQTHRPYAAKTAASIYLLLGFLIAGDNLMYSYGLLYLPVSTYSLLCATQLAFNALFSYFLNSQKFTPFILNSILLLTLAAALLGVHSTTSSADGNHHLAGFALTISASATFSLIMSLMQLSFQKVLKIETFAVVLEMILWTNFVASVVSVAGLFAGGEWRGIQAEFEGFEKGGVSYGMTLAGIAVSWLVYSVGAVGLIYAVSSLFANVIATLALPLVPVFAVVFFDDTMDGVKVVALLIALLGFGNFGYQHYLDDSKAKKNIGREG